MWELTLEGSTGDFRPKDSNPFFWYASCVNAVLKNPLNKNLALISHICEFSWVGFVVVDSETVSGVLKRKSGLHAPRLDANGATISFPSPSIHCATY
jgi:hypothetical protein